MSGVTFNIASLQHAGSCDLPAPLMRIELTINKPNGMQMIGL